MQGLGPSHLIIASYLKPAEKANASSGNPSPSTPVDLKRAECDPFAVAVIIPGTYKLWHNNLIKIGNYYIDSHHLVYLHSYKTLRYN